MTSHHDHRRRLCVLATWLLTVAAILGAFESSGTLGQTLPPVDELGVEGGLAVWIFGDLTPADWAKDLARLHTSKGLLVLGLHPDDGIVRDTQAELMKLGHYGPVSVDTLDLPGRWLVPMVDDSVNLLIASTGCGVSREEALRVLAPLGVILARDGQSWKKITKPWPDDIDEWTHYLHDASNNAVAHDDRVGPPRHLQWQCGPRWGRHHDHMASVSAMVTARGRVFSILDEGSRVSPQLPPDWKLVARDAFNGVLLWKRTIPRWHDNLWPLKSGPASLPRRLVAEGPIVYATLGIEAPVTALDAATGRTLREYPGTEKAEEIVLTGGVLLVLVNRTPVDLDADLAVDPEEGASRDSRTTYSPKMGRIWAGIRSPRWSHGDRSILAFDAENGRPLWQKAGRVIPLSLAADQKNVYYHDQQKIVALDLADGQQRWASDPVPVWQGLHGQGLQSWFAPTLVAHQGTILFAGGEKIHMSYMGWGSKDIGQDTMTAFSADTGQKLWTADHPYSGYNSPEDLFVAAGKVWTGVTAQGGPHGRYTGHSLRTGQVQNDFPPTVDTFWFHHRCYRAKATDKYILSSRTGIEFVDLQTGQWTINHWVRGGCLYGIMPAGGLIYSPPHPCSCYPEAKLNGFTALAAAS
ncbi:PQQ-binding-like beta-propeller repeat protein, partial [Planctomycetota bacterium]